MKLSDVAAAAGGATAGQIWTHPDRTLTEITGTPRENLVGTNAPILSDGIPFKGAFIDMHISSVAVSGGATAGEIWAYSSRTLTGITGTPRSDLIGADESLYTYYSTVRAKKLDFIDASISTRAKPDDILSDSTPFPGGYIDAAISSRATAGDSPNPTYYTTTRATKLDNLDAAISSRATAGQVWTSPTRTLTDPDSYKADVSKLDASVSTRATQGDILSDATPFPGAYIDKAISEVAGASATAMWEHPTRTLTGFTGTARSDLIGADEALYTYYSTARAQKLDYLDALISSRATQGDILSDATPFPGANIDAAISSRATAGDSPDPTYYSTTRATKLDNLDVLVSSRATQGDILSDATPFPGGNIDAAISSRATAGDSPDPTYYSTTRATKLDNLDALISSRATPGDSPDPAFYTTTRATKLDNLDVLISSRATAGDSPDPTYYSTTRATKLDNLDAAVSSRSSHSAADVWAVATRTLTGITGTPRSDIIGADEPLYTYYSTARAQKLDHLDADISSRATPSDSPDPTYYSTTRATKLDNLDALVSSRATQGDILSDATPFPGANIDAAISSRATAGQSPDPAFYTTTRATKLDHLDADISSRATAGESPDPSYYTTTRATKLDNLDALISSRATAGQVWVSPTRTLTDPDSYKADVSKLDASVSTRATQGDILSDASPFAGANIDVAISSRATAGDSPDPTYYSTTRATKLDNLDALISSRATQGDILSDATPLPGANIDAAISSRATAGDSPDPSYYTTTRATKLDNLDALISSRATAGDSPDPSYFTTTRGTKLDYLDASVSAVTGATAGEVWTSPTRTLTDPDSYKADVSKLDASVSTRATQGDILSDGTPFSGANIDAAISSRAVAGDSPDPSYYTTTRATKLDNLDALISSRATAGDSPDPTYYTTTRATKLDNLDVLVSSRATVGDILSDGVAFLGANIDAAISSRATAGDSPDPAYYTTTRATKLDNLDALISSRATQGDILSDGTPFAGANIDAAISSRATAGQSPDPAYYTTARAVKIDYLDASVSVAGKGRFSDESGSFVWQAATYATAETDISALFTTSLTGTTRRRYAVYLDMTKPAADATAWATCTLRTKVKIDGANARSVDKKDFAKTDWAAAAEPGVPIDIPMVAQDVQITMQFLYSLAANATVYYHYVREVLE